MGLLGQWVSVHVQALLTLMPFSRFGEPIDDDAQHAIKWANGAFYQSHHLDDTILRFNNPREWNVHRNNLVFAYSTQIYRAKRCVPLELVLPNQSHPTANRPNANDQRSITETQNVHRWQWMLSNLIGKAGTKMTRAHEMDQEDFNVRMRTPREVIKSRKFVSMQKANFGPNDK